MGVGILGEGNDDGGIAGDGIIHVGIVCDGNDGVGIDEGDTAGDGIIDNVDGVGIIGGGVVGASILYHLSKLGCSDAIMLERSELTSGSTWHAAGGIHTINGDPNVAKLQQYTIQLYKEIKKLIKNTII